MPVRRVISNLERKLWFRSNNGELHAQLARAYSILFATEGYAQEFHMWITDSDPRMADQVILRNFSNISELRGTNVPALSGRARASNLQTLTNALTHYNKAIELGFTNAFVYLGLGWTQQLAGNTNAARENYRTALKFSVGYKQVLHEGGDVSVTLEAATLLRSLLDEEKDRDEIERIRVIRRNTRDPAFLPVSPIIVALHDDARLVDLIDWNARVSFNLDGTGVKEWNWISTNAAWLVYKRNPQEPVTTGIQLFGNVTFWIFWANGYDALSSLDNDQNGFLEGAELHDLYLWHDANSNGRSDPGEVLPVSYFGIEKLSTSGRSLTSGDIINVNGATFRDRTTRPTFDILLRQPKE